MKIEIGGKTLVLHPSGALLLKESNILIISDVHFGKVMHFRKHGMAVPAASLFENFEKLTAVADEFQAKTICFLGDLFHSKINKEWFFFEDWIRSREEHFILVKGNHDVIPVSFYENIGIEVVNEIIEQPFFLVHEPESKEDHFTICGHIHPGIKLAGFGGERLNLPCFFRSENQLIVPAFGTFTGKYTLRPGEGEIAYAIAGKEIVEIEG